MSFFNAVKAAVAMLIASTALSGCAGCAGAKKSESTAHHPVPFATGNASLPGGAKRLWSKKMPGLVTDLNVSAASGDILTAVIPDPERSSGEKQDYQLMLLDPTGTAKWSSAVGSPVKAQSISDDGSLAVFSNHNEEVIAIDGSGKTAWKVQANCKPLILSRLKKVLCYHDDDVGPGVAFDIFDWDGKKLESYPSKRDILAMKVATDEKSFAIALTRGQVIMFGPDLKSVWEKKVKGEVLDLAVSNGPDASVAVLYGAAKAGQKLVVFDSKGEIKAEGAPASHVEQVEIDPSGAAVMAYGNGPKGQFLGYYPVTSTLTEKWHRGDSHHADYSPNMISASGLAIIGFEDVSPSTRHSHIISFDSEGSLVWDVPLVTQEGAYLYAQSFSSQQKFLAVATDDGMLAAYRVTR